MRYDALVVAGGVGKRAGLGYNKVFFVMDNGHTVLENSLSLFLEDDDCDKVIVVVNEKLPFDSDKIITVKGGRERYDSVMNGLSLATSDFVFIHDGARPFLMKEDLEVLKKEMDSCDGAILAIPSADTVKVVKDGVITSTIDRSTVFLAATPQAFRREALLDAYRTVDLKGVTDDASVFEKLGREVRVVPCDRSNRKLTVGSDFK